MFRISFFLAASLCEERSFEACLDGMRVLPGRVGLAEVFFFAIGEQGISQHPCRLNRPQAVSPVHPRLSRLLEKE